MIGWLEEGETLHNHGFRTTLTGWGHNSRHGKPHLVEIQLHHKQRGTIGAYSEQNDDWLGRFKMMQHYDDECNTPPSQGATVVAFPLTA
jgi:hypothetical protein